MIDGAAVDRSRTEGSPTEASVGAWAVLAEERFETALPVASWSQDTYPDDGPFSDDGVYFTDQGISPPTAHRLSVPFGAGGWLTIESYTRDSGTKLSQLAAIVPDPDGSKNQVLQITSPAHTDATVIRPTSALPSRYRVSLRVGYPQFGDGKNGPNGYDSGDETAEPWLSDDATAENGFYWLTILDAVPRPHNNIWLHHHRKVVLDSDNNYPPWMEIYDGSSFEKSGVNPVMLFAVGNGKGNETSGKPFLSWAAGQWQPAGEIRAVDAYKPGTWYRVIIERFDDRFTITISGDFRYGGTTSYSATIDARAQCVWHYNNTPLEASSPCIDDGHYAALDSTHPHWPAGKAWPDYFFFGDPHSNYYEGLVYYDDLKLEVWK